MGQSYKDFIKTPVMPWEHWFEKLISIKDYNGFLVVAELFLFPD